MGVLPFSSSPGHETSGRRASPEDAKGASTSSRKSRVGADSKFHGRGVCQRSPASGETLLGGLPLESCLQAESSIQAPPKAGRQQAEG
jgi:hypothetical protein